MVVEWALASPDPVDPAGASLPPSDNTLRRALRKALAVADLNTTSASSLRKQLETRFGCELRDRKALIKDEIARFIEEANNKAEIEAYNNGKGAEVAEEDGQDEHEGEDNGGALGGTRSWAREALRKKGKGPAPKKKIEKKKGGGGTGGFSKQICVLSPELAAVVGSNEMSRTQVVKGVWEYVRAHELQNPKDKRKIMVDELLSKVFPNKSVTMFSMNKYLSSHIKAKADVTAASL